jgi:hypothetical protein
MGDAGPDADPLAGLKDLLIGKRLKVDCRGMDVVHLGGRIGVTIRIDNPELNGFQQVCVPLERVAVVDKPAEPTEPSIDRLTEALLRSR